MEDFRQKQMQLSAFLLQLGLPKGPPPLELRCYSDLCDHVALTTNGDPLYS